MKPPAAAADAHVALAAQRLDRARGERRRGGHRGEAQHVGRAVLRERGELAEQSLGLVRLVRAGELGHVGAQRHDLAGGHLVGCALHVLGLVPRAAAI